VQNILDLGCGEGYYDTALQQAHPGAQLYGVDIAKPAVRMASKRHQQGRFAVASAWQLPVLDDSLDIVLRVFAPSDDKELCRVLAPGGHYLEVTPGPRHLWALRKNLYDTPREHASTRTSIVGLSLREQLAVKFELTADQSLLQDIVAMTPFAHRGHREKRAQLLDSTGWTLEMAFSLCLFQRDVAPAGSAQD
jgi:23S rRNA (guanine745-N1)-methyltransferase